MSLLSVVKAKEKEATQKKLDIIKQAREEYSKEQLEYMKKVDLQMTAYDGISILPKDREDFIFSEVLKYAPHFLPILEYNYTRTIEDVIAYTDGTQLFLGKQFYTKPVSEVMYCIYRLCAGILLGHYTEIRTPVQLQDNRTCRLLYMYALKYLYDFTERYILNYSSHSIGISEIKDGVLRDPNSAILDKLKTFDFITWSDCSKSDISYSVLMAVKEAYEDSTQYNRDFYIINLMPYKLPTNSWNRNIVKIKTVPLVIHITKIQLDRILNVCKKKEMIKDIEVVQTSNPMTQSLPSTSTPARKSTTPNKSEQNPIKSAKWNENEDSPISPVEGENHENFNTDDGMGHPVPQSKTGEISNGEIGNSQDNSTEFQQNEVEKCTEKSSRMTSENQVGGHKTNEINANTIEDCLNSTSSLESLSEEEILELGKEFCKEFEKYNKEKYNEWCKSITDNKANTPSEQFSQLKDLLTEDELNLLFNSISGMDNVKQAVTKSIYHEYSMLDIPPVAIEEAMYQYLSTLPQEERDAWFERCGGMYKSYHKFYKEEFNENARNEIRKNLLKELNIKEEDIPKQQPTIDSLQLDISELQELLGVEMSDILNSFQCNQSIENFKTTSRDVDVTYKRIVKHKAVGQAEGEGKLLNRENLPEYDCDTSFYEQISDIVKSLERGKHLAYNPPDKRYYYRNLILPSVTGNALKGGIKFLNIFIDSSDSMNEFDVGVAVSAIHALETKVPHSVRVWEFNETIQELEVCNGRLLELPKSSGTTHIELVLNHLNPNDSGRCCNFVITDGFIDWKLVFNYMDEMPQSLFVFLITGKYDLTPYKKRIDAHDMKLRFIFMEMDEVKSIRGEVWHV